MKTSQSAFTLIELLVVVAIMGILAGLLLPAVLGGMKAAYKTRDINNARSIAQILIMEAMDNDGVFRTGRNLAESSAAGSSLEVFQGLLDDGKIDEPKVFFGQGARLPKSLQLADENIGFQYIAGLNTTSPGSLPLLFSKGVALDPQSLNGTTFTPGTSAWQKEGFVVASVGGQAFWAKNTGKKDTIELAAPLVLNRVPTNIRVCP